MKKFLTGLLALLSLASVRGDELIPLKLELPKELYIGTPRPIELPNLEKPRPGNRPDLMVPAGTILLSKDKPVTGSDNFPVIGELALITDGDKSGADGSYVECGPGLQWVQVDLGATVQLAAIALWHFHSQARAYHDVIVQASDDPAFKTGVRTLFNDDSDNSAALGAGRDLAYIENREGKLIDAQGATARYVRLYSNGNTSDELNHYCEVEVFGAPTGAATPAPAPAVTTAAVAGLRLPAIFGDHMVLQQKLANPVWGWDKPGTAVTVTFAGQSHAATVGADGRWSVKLDPLPANATPQILTVTGSTKREFQDVLVGEVWMCSGQSNMQLRLNQDWNGDLEAAASKHPNLRLIRVPPHGTQELQDDFKGEWQAATPETVAPFSALGFLYGRYLHEILDVPVGLIGNYWAGSSAEAWVRRSSLEGEPRFAPLMTGTHERETKALLPAATAAHEQALKKWEEDKTRAAKTGGRPPRRPEAPEAWLAGFNRAGNIFAGVVHPTLGYGIKGVIWYQGEGNASRAVEYDNLFPFLIEQWRKEWGQGDFPFYWVQLPDWADERPEPGESSQARLREAQTKTMRLPHTGQAVTIDLGEGNDRHPRNKHDIAARIVRWALVKDYGMTLPYRSPEFKSVALAGGKALITFDCFGSSLRPFDVDEVRGFAVCGEDKVWHWATGRIVGQDQVELSSTAVAAPIAVRYAWADNPVCNLFSNDGLPATPFRTDDFAPVPRTKSPEPSSSAP